MAVPKLRFPEFTGKWDEYTLNYLLKINSGRDYKHLQNGNIPVYGTGGLIGYVNKSISNEDAIGIGRKGTINNPYFLEAPFWTVDTLFFCTIRNKFNLEFTLKLIEKLKLEEYNEATGVPSLSKNNLDKIIVSAPTLPEQTKIAKIFSLLDHKISLQRRKVDLMNLYKKGILQRVFSRNASNFQVTNIGKIFEITRGVVIAKTDISEKQTNINCYPIYSSQTSNNGIMGYDSVYDFNGKFLTWTTDGANAGRVFYRNGKFRCTNVCGVLVEKYKGNSNRYMAELLNKYTYKYVSYVGNPKLMNGVMASIPLSIPPLNIQIEYSRVFKQLDKNINLNKQKLDKLELFKKGILQKMFV
ncbi:MAG: restriction endonuclease subunit S [Oscillospiraceae bacterium]|nr:restriction endonuclease subunit S [Oscillospiraceae bacterium]